LPFHRQFCPGGSPATTLKPKSQTLHDVERVLRNLELLVAYRLRVEHLRRGIIWDWCTALLAFLRIEGKNLSHLIEWEKLSGDSLVTLLATRLPLGLSLLCPSLFQRLHKSVGRWRLGGIRGVCRFPRHSFLKLFDAPTQIHQHINCLLLARSIEIYRIVPIHGTSAYHSNSLSQEKTKNSRDMAHLCAPFQRALGSFRAKPGGLTHPTQQMKALHDDLLQDA